MKTDHIHIHAFSTVFLISQQLNKAMMRNSEDILDKFNNADRNCTSVTRYSQECNKTITTAMKLWH
jgi:hypothetical protein